MAKKEKQLALLDVGPENLAEIIPHIKAYEEAKAERLAFLKTEVQEKKTILALVNEAGLSRLPNGDIRFTCDGSIVTISPTDDKISVKEDPDE